MKKKLLAGLLAAVIAISIVGVIGYDLLLENGPAVTTLTCYKINYIGNTGAPQQQLPDTVIQFVATFEIDHGFFNLIHKKAVVNFDDFYVTSNNRTLTPLQGYSELMSHGEYTIESGNLYVWEGMFVVEKGISTCELHYNGPLNMNIVYVNEEFPISNYYASLPVIGK